MRQRPRPHLQRIVFPTARALRLAAAPAGWLVSALLAGCPAPTPPLRAAPDPPGRHAEVVAALLRPLLDGEWVPGLAVGLIGPDGVETYGFGRVRDDEPTPPDEHTVFEIGSVTKVFTALLLADSVRRGDVRLDEPVADLLPFAAAAGSPGEVPITLEDLVTHASGLPRMPDDLNPADPAQPYADYTTEQLEAFLTRRPLSRAADTPYEYSNLGAGLLGFALSARAGRTYAELLAERITGPLGLSDTVIALDEERQGRLAVPHDVDGRPVPLWTFDVLAPCGALRSTVADLLLFLQANLAAPEGSLGPALQAMHEPRRPSDLGRVGLGWHVSDAGVIWHNGGTAGSHAFLAFAPDLEVGVVVLANGASFVVDRAGSALLSLLAGGEASLELPPTPTLAPETLERYVGRYDLGDETILDVTRDGTTLWARVTGQDICRLFPLGETEFAWRIVPASLTFRLGADGVAEAAVLHQDGADLEAARLPP